MNNFNVTKKTFETIIANETRKCIIGVATNQKEALNSLTGYCFQNFELLNKVESPSGGYVKGNFIWSAIGGIDRGIISILIVTDRADFKEERQVILARQIGYLKDHIKQMKAAGFTCFEIQTWRLTMYEESNLSPITLVEHLSEFATEQNITINLNVPMTYSTIDIEKSFGDKIHVDKLSNDIQPAEKGFTSSTLLDAYKRAKGKISDSHKTHEVEVEVKEPCKPRIYKSIGDILKGTPNT